VGQNQPTISDRIQALLAEYDACYQTRDRYVAVQWTIGSIFIAGALILLGGSFQIRIQTRLDLLNVLYVSVVSLVLVFIWFAYFQHVQPLIDQSYKRAKEIEDLLNYYFGAAWLQLQTRYLSQHPKGRGAIITICLLVLMLTAAVVRVILAVLAL
jgi:hypothetical protein